MGEVRLAKFLPSRDATKFLIDDPREISEFVSAWKSSGVLESFHISDGQLSIGKEVAAVIGNVLASHGELKELHMIAAFKGRQIDEVVECLKRLSAGIARSGCRLRLIDISQNAFRGTGIDAMREILTGPACYSLEVLNVSDQGLSPEGGETVAKVLRDLHQNAVRDGEQLALHTFKASKNRIENGGALKLGPVFKELKTLREVEMYQCGIWAKGVASIMKGLSTNRELRFLDIMDNSVNDEAEDATAQAICNWPHLEDLRLSSCLITSQGMVKILTSVRDTCRAIKTLDLSDNDADKSVQSEVLDLLAGMPSLESVVLKGNEFFTKVTRAMFEARFEEMGKSGVLKNKLDSGHTYGPESDEEEEDEDEEPGEDDGDSDGSSKNTVEEKHAADEEDEEDDSHHDDFLLEREGTSVWSSTFGDIKRSQYEPFDQVNLFAKRLQRNNCFTLLGITVGEINTLFEEKKYREVVLKVVDLVCDFVRHLDEEDDEKRLAADHQLEAVLQLTEYLVAYSVFLVGTAFFEEIVRCCGLLQGSALPSEDQLRALAWLLRHVLASNSIPLYTVGKISDSVKSDPQARRLRDVEGFSSVFGELERQSSLE